MAIGGQLTEADAVAAQYLNLRPRLAFTVAGSLLLALCAWAFWHGRSLVLLACVAFLGLHFGFWMPFQARRRFRQHQALSEPMSIGVREDGLFFRRQNGEGLVPWSHIVKWRHNPRLVLLYPASNVFHLVPRHFFPEAQAYADFLATLHARIGKPF